MLSQAPLRESAGQTECRRIQPQGVPDEGRPPTRSARGVAPELPVLIEGTAQI